MSNLSSSLSGPNWYAVHTLSNQEAKAKQYLDKFVAVEAMEDYIFEVLMPTETVTEVKEGKKRTITRKFYPGYIFVNMCNFRVNIVLTVNTYCKLEFSHQLCQENLLICTRSGSRRIFANF